MTYVTLPKMRLLNIRTSSTSFRRGGVNSEIVENLKKKKKEKMKNSSLYLLSF